MKKILAFQIVIIFSLIIIFSGCAAPDYSYNSIFIHLIESEEEAYYDATVLLHYSIDGEIDEDYSNEIADKFSDELEKSLDTDVELINNDWTLNEVEIKIKNFATLSKSGWSETYMITLQKEVGELRVIYPDAYEYKDYNTRTLPHVRHKNSPELSNMFIQSENRKNMYDEISILYHWNTYNQKFMMDIVTFSLNGLFNIGFSESVEKPGIPFESVKKFNQEEWDTWQKQNAVVLHPFTVQAKNENFDTMPFWKASEHMSEYILKQNELIEKIMRDNENYYKNLN